MDFANATFEYLRLPTSSSSVAAVRSFAHPTSKLTTLNAFSSTFFAPQSDGMNGISTFPTNVLIVSVLIYSWRFFIAENK